MDGKQKRQEKGGFHFPLKFRRSRKKRSGTTEAPVPVKAVPSVAKFPIPETEKNSESTCATPVEGPAFKPEETSGDLQRTQMRYRAALGNFEKALQSRGAGWKSIDISSFRDDASSGALAQHLQGEVETMLQSQRKGAGNQDFWKKGRAMMETLFATLSPLAKNVLGIAKTASSMHGAEPFGLMCSGLAVLITIADKEIARRNDVEKKLDYIVRQLGALRIVEKLPKAGLETDQLVNRALDVVSASLNFLSAQVFQHRHGVLQSVAITFVAGERDYGSVEADLKTAVDEFNSALAQFGHGVGFKVFELLQGAIGEARLEPPNVSTPEEKFIVPYQRNHKFTGRCNLLSVLRSRLCCEKVRAWNHRIALYGLGGVGKTQLALEYVHSQKDIYDRIYWISAASEEALISGFQQIASQTHWVHQNASLQPKEVVAIVLNQLRQRENWLLVFDNLDDFELLDNCLPDVGTNKHTLITTRNPNCHQIPAEGLEVGVLDIDDATEFLLTRSNITPAPPAKTEASNIVKELGCLPLAVEQAAAYIRETLKDIFKYLSSYRRSQRSHHERLSKANRTYYEKSIATTWSMSFLRLSADASALLRVLSFLNPDGILTDFLEAGQEGLCQPLNEIFDDIDRRCEALSELERFSLIRRQDEANGGELITMHRLVQSVVKDDLSEELFAGMQANAVRLCIYGFPEGDFQYHPTLVRCRRFYGQVVGLLSTIKDIQHAKLGCLLHRLGVFLVADGKFREAVIILERARSTMDKVLEKESPCILRTATDLAWAYYESGQLQDSLDLAEKVLTTRQALDGEEQSEATLSIMGGVAGLYCGQGRYTLAAEMQRKVADNSKSLLGPHHRDTLRAVEALSLIYVLQGLWTEAAELQEEVLESRRRVFGDDSLLTYAAMTNLAGIYQYQGRFEAARTLTESTVEARLRLLGNHPWTFWAQMSLGTVWAECGRLQDSLKMLLHASDGLASTLGTKHPMTLIAMANLGYGYSDQRIFDKSIQVLEVTVANSSKVSGTEHFYTLWMKECLAEVYHRQGYFEKAICLLEIVVQSRRTVLGESHCITLANESKLQRWRKNAGIHSKDGVASSDDQFQPPLSEAPLRLRNTSAWLSFLLKPLPRWE